jgi:hypothetical protein
VIRQKRATDLAVSDGAKLGFYWILSTEPKYRAAVSLDRAVYTSFTMRLQNSFKDLANRYNLSIHLDESA